MTLIEKIEVLKKKNSLNNRQLSLQSGIPYSTIDNWYKRGAPDDMRLPTFGKLCSFFNVTMESMAYDELDIVYKPTGPTDPVVLSDGENNLMRKYRDMNDEGKEKIQERADELLQLGYKKGSDSSLADAG